MEDKQTTQDPRIYRQNRQIGLDPEREEDRIILDLHSVLVMSKANQIESGIDDELVGRSWKPTVIEALLLYIELLYGQTSLLEKMKPDIARYIRICEALERGDWSVLMREMPERYEVMMLQQQRQALLGSADENTEVLRDVKLQIKALNKKIDRLQSLPGTAQHNTTPLPIDDSGDDVDLEVTKDKDAGKRANFNFLKSIQNLDSSAKPKPVQPKQLQVQQFDVPDFDDDDMIVVTGD